MKTIFKTTILLMSIMLLTSSFFVSCEKDNETDEPKTVITVTTTQVTQITPNSAKSGGSMTITGNAAVDGKGVCWSTTQNPTIQNSKTADGIGYTAYVSNMTGLNGSTTYYVRAYVTYNKGIVYGNEISFTTSPNPTKPTVTTNTVYSITQTTATVGGDVTLDGGATVTERGICYSKSLNPTIENATKIQIGNGLGAFSSSLTNLTNNTTYYVRAYAINSVGISYGNEVSFTTSPNPIKPTVTTSSITNITQTTATVGGNVTSDGGATVTERGVCYSTNQNPTINDLKVSSTTTTGLFTSNLSGLSANTTYYVRAYATNSIGTSYGDQMSFTTSPLVIVAPTITTTEVSNITQTTAVSGGSIISNGNGAITASGICYSTSQNPTINDLKVSSTITTGSFTSNLSGLSANTTYYVRAYATNSAGTSYGLELSFTTLPQPVLPTIVTVAVSNITVATAVSGGYIISNGNGVITARGVCYSTSQNPTINDLKVSSTATSTFFTSNLSGLSANTTYYVRAYATNSAGTGYGDQMSFTTKALVLPTITTTAVTNIINITAVSGGTITSNGGSVITASGVCYSTSPNPTINDLKVSSTTTSGSFTSNLSGLSQNTTYYVRAYATNSVGTGYGDQVSFITKSSIIVAPVIYTTTVTNVTPTTAVSGGTITTNGNGAITASGVCYSTSPNPTINDLKVSSTTTTGSFTSNLSGLSDNTTYYVRAYATNSAGTGYGDQMSFTTKALVFVGMTYQDGIVGYMFKSGETGYVAGEYHGLLVKSEDQSSGTTWENAKTICSNLGTGWHLPNFTELHNIWTNRSIIGGFISGQYWSSDTDYASGVSFAKTLFFDNGYNAPTYKTSDWVKVRAVKAF